MFIVVEEIYTVKYAVGSEGYTEEQALQLVRDRKVAPIHSEFKELNGQRLAEIRTIDEQSWWAYEFIRSIGKFAWVLCSRNKV